MKEFSQFGGQRQHPGNIPTPRESQLIAQLSQCRTMLESMMKGYNNQKAEVNTQRAQIEELTKLNEQLKQNQGQS